MLLTPQEVRVIGGILDLGLGRASYTLVELLEDEVTIHPPSIAILPVSELDSWLRSKSNFQSPIPSHSPTALLHFHGPFSGTLALVFPIESAIGLASRLNVEPTPAGLQEVVEETGNLLLNAVAGSIANCLDCELLFETPYYTDASAIVAGLKSDDVDVDNQILIAQACFALAGSAIEGQILLRLDERATSALAAAIGSMAGNH